ncbi:MAG: DUF2505 domain-containing protein [Myxococcota bacterium]
MKLNVRHRFDCTPEVFWEMYWDEAFDAALREESAVTREVLEEREEDGVLIRRVRFTPDRELPGPAAALLGTSKLVYEQENRWDKASNTMHWKVIPTILPGKLDAQGTFRVVEVPGGCEQIVEGDISVNVRFIGGQIEKAVVSEVEKSYDKTAATSREWLKKRAQA